MPKIDFSKVILRDNGQTVPEDLIPAEIPTEQFVEMFSRHDLRINRMLKQAEDFEIVDDKSNETAVSMGSNAQAAVKELMELEKKIVKPHKDFVAAIKKARVMYTDRLNNIKQLFAGKVSIWAQKKRVEAEKAAKKEREKAEAFQKKLAAEAKKHDIEAPEVKIPDVKVPATRTTKTEKGTSYQKKRWTYEVTDLNKVPRKYLTLNKQQVTKDLRAHTDGDSCNLKVPGIRFYQVEDTVFKTA